MEDYSILNQYLDHARVPGENDKVYKEECLLSFDTVYSKAGLFISLRSFQCYSQNYVHQYSQKSGDLLFLNIRRILNEERSKERKNKKVERLAIGVEGGFDADDSSDYDELLSLSCMNPINLVIPLPNPNLPKEILDSIEGILRADSAEHKEKVQKWIDDRQLIESRYSKTLHQISPPEDSTPIDLTDCKCKKCDKKDNLWLCLTCGQILCGRRNFDGSGGNNHMVEHFEEERHPLVVKVGTITPEGADVFSYEEDDMVIDTNLKQHLAHWGIDQSSLKKSDFSMAELEIMANSKLELASIAESGKVLKPVTGPGYTGLANLGNSCYLASTMQVLFTLPEWQSKFFDPDMKIFDTLSLNEEYNSNLELQLTKLANGLLSGDYSTELASDGSTESGYQVGIPPRSFKNCIGKDHPEFSSGRQQDALEFFQYLLSKCEGLPSGDDLVRVFRYKSESRMQCMESQMVKYTYNPEIILQLPVPMELATGYSEYKQFQENKKSEESGKSSTEAPPIPTLSMATCIQKFAEPNYVDFYSSAVKAKVLAQHTTRLATFPNYLAIQIPRYYLDGYQPKKLEVLLMDVESIDISSLRGTGLKENEVLLPEDDSNADEPQFNADVLNNLIAMGFDELHAKNAMLNGCNTVDAAISFIFENQGSDILTRPIEKAKPQILFPDVDSSLVSQIVSMGLGEVEARAALHLKNNNIEAAMDLMFSDMDAIQQAIAAETEKSSSPSKEFQYDDGEGKYELIAMISHIGNSTSHGHYVAHIKKNGEWIMFNDRRVAKSEEPPFGMAYIYFYKRV